MNVEVNHDAGRQYSRLLQKNQLRTDFQQHYEQIAAEYNREKDRQKIEATFEALMKLVNDLGLEETRAMREGLEEETLPLFDILKKPDLNAKDIKPVKRWLRSSWARLRWRSSALSTAGIGRTPAMPSRSRFTISFTEIKLGCRSQFTQRKRWTRRPQRFSNMCSVCIQRSHRRIMVKRRDALISKNRC